MTQNNQNDSEDYLKEVLKERNHKPTRNANSFNQRVNELNPNLAEKRNGQNKKSEFNVAGTPIFAAAATFILFMCISNAVIMALSKEYPSYVEFIGTLLASMIGGAFALGIAIISRKHL